MRFKSSVELDPMTPALVRMLGAIDMCARMMQIDFTVSCGRERHASGDPHTRGAALDVSVANLTPDVIVRSHQYLQRILDGPFTVLYEVPSTPVNGALKNIAYINSDATAPHFHLQSLKGTVYPPQDQEELERRV